MNQPLLQPSSGKPALFQTVSLLIVEDNPDHQLLIKLALEKSMPGVQAVSVASEAEALAHLAAADHQGYPLPRLILLDLYLPARTDGLLTLNSLKAYFRSRPQPPVPVIMFSYSDQPDDVRTCYGRGANAYMVKSADYREWVGYFDQLRNYWLNTVTLPRF